MREARRVVITGMGCVTPIGVGREAFWRALLGGASGVRRIEEFDVTNSPVKIAAAVRGFDDCFLIAAAICLAGLLPSLFMRRPAAAGGSHGPVEA